MPNMRSTREKSSSLYKTDVLFDILEKKSIIRSGWITFICCIVDHPVQSYPIFYCSTFQMLIRFDRLDPLYEFDVLLSWLLFTTQRA